MINNDFFKWNLIKGAKTEGNYDMPILAPSIITPPTNLVPFNAHSSCKYPQNNCLHFYIDDYHFERIWNNPTKYLDKLKAFKQVITPDFSIYMYMPKPQQIWNCWRNRVLAYWMQKNGVSIIPSVGWGDLETFDWAFDGIPHNSMLAITTQGCITNHVCMRSLVNGIHTLIKEKSPTSLIVYGSFKEEWYNQFPIPIYRFPSFSESKWR